MLRKCVLGLSAAALTTVGVVAWRTNGTAEPRRPTPESPAPANGGRALKQTSPLPIAQVVLFNSGVGYFQRAGEVEGDARVDLAFPAIGVNDLIKSLLVEDAHGRTMPLRYDSQEPVEKALRSFAIDLSSNPSLGQILNQARGEKVEVSLAQAAAGLPATLTGTIVGMESQQRPAAGAGQPGGEVEVLNLLCPEGVRAVALRDVQRLRFLSPALEAELRRALEVVAVAHDSQRKAVRLEFKGEGRREVKVGYVAENPIWKTSYRLVLGAKAKPRLVGWANVENTSDEDWNDVRLTLVSGRPISFQMDLYPPLYIPRPTVEPELFASLRPPTYQGPLAGWLNNPNFGMMGGANSAPFGNNSDGRNGVPMGQQGGGGGFAAGMNPNFFMAQNGVNQLGNLGGQFGFQGGQFGAQGGAGNNRYQFNTLMLQNGTAQQKLTYHEMQARRNQEQAKASQQARDQAQQIGSMITNVDPGLVEAALTSEELGNPARYAIEERVTLPRQQSAMLPILDQPVEVTRVSIYNEKVQAKHPLLGLRVKNSTKQSLMQGPVTVYDDGQYAGDARVPDLQPGEERFVSYAVDTGVEVKPFDKVAPGPEMTATMANGQLQIQYRLRQTRTYVIKNRSPEAREVVIEQPVRDGWTLVAPAKPAERTRDLYRFAVTVKPGETAKYDVAEELPRSDPFQITRQADWSGFATSLGLDVWTDSKRTPEDEFVIQVVPAETHANAAGAANAPHGQAGWKGSAQKPAGFASGPGVLRVTHKDRRETTFFFRNRVGEARTVWLEHVVPSQRRLLGDAKPVADNAQRYRFKLELAPGKTVSHCVTEELAEATAEPFDLRMVEGAPPPRPGTDDLPQMRYVTELGFEVWTDRSRHPDSLTRVRLVKGQVDTMTRESETLAYHVRNRSGKARTFVVEHVVRPEWTLAGKDKPVAGAGQRYRFPLRAADDTPLKQEVTEERQVGRREAVSALGEQRVKEILASASTGPAVKESLAKASGMLASLAETQGTLAELRVQVKEIAEEQARVRLNLEKLPADSALYRRYLSKLDQQETGLERAQGQLTQRAEAEKRQKKELDAFLGELNVD